MQDTGTLRELTYHNQISKKCMACAAK